MTIIQLLLKAISPQLRKLFVDFILGLSDAAAKTDNPIDDVVVAVLIVAFAINDKKELPK